MNKNEYVLTLQVPDYIELSRPKITQIILEVTDNDVPNLTRYQRIIVNIMPGKELE